VHEKENPHKPATKVLKTREEMQTTLKNQKKVVVDFLKSVFKRKNIIEEGGTLGSRVKRK
jgi:hypothetical protein